MKRRSFLTAALAGGACLVGRVGPAVAAVDPTVPEQYLPRYVRLKTELAPFEVHVDPGQFALFWTLPDREAIRYTVGIARPGLYHAGTFHVGAKREWPSWTPTASMIRRNPAYARWADGMPGGRSNPLGARALYLHDAQGRDTYLRIHGTNRPDTIATRVSNGCARLVNSHVVDLYGRVPLATRVVLYPA